MWQDTTAYSDRQCCLQESKLGEAGGRGKATVKRGQNRERQHLSVHLSVRSHGREGDDEDDEEGDSIGFGSCSTTKKTKRLYFMAAKAYGYPSIAVQGAAAAWKRGEGVAGGIGVVLRCVSYYIKLRVRITYIHAYVFSVQDSLTV